MSSWLKETIESLGEKQQERDETFNVFQSVLVLLLVIRRLDLSTGDAYAYFVDALDYKHYKILFQGLCMIPGWKTTKSWPDLMSAKEILDNNKADIVHVLIKMHNKAVHFNQPLPEVLFSVPVFHFTKGTWEPFKDASNLLSFGVELRGPFAYFKGIITKR